MMGPIIAHHEDGFFLSVIRLDDGGFQLSGFNPETGRVINGYEPTQERAAAWVDGLRLLFAGDGEAAQ